MITESMAKFIYETNYKGIPQDGIDIAKKAILDCIGCIIAGSAEHEVDLVVQFIKEIGGTPEATVISRGFKTSSPQAALVNGVSGHVLDYDDCAEDRPASKWLGHPTVALLPAILSLGEKYKASGKEFIESYVIGFEAGGKIGLGVGKHYEAGWHTTSTLGTMGAAAAAAKLLKLDVTRTRMALGIAASLASGLRQNFGTMTKSLHAGIAGYNGVLAASLAKKGYSAHPNILEAPSGFARLMSDGGKFDPGLMSQNLGAPFAIVSDGVDLKPYPCCRFAHRCIDAALYLKNKHGIQPSEVDEVICNTSSLIPEYLIYPFPKTRLEAKFSLQYCVAAALIDGKVGLKQFTNERINCADIQSYLSKVKYDHSYKSTNLSAAMAEPEELIIRLRNGETYAHSITIARGDFRNPMTRDEIIFKFKDCTSLVFDGQQQEQILDMVTNLENLDEVPTLTELLIHH